MVIKALFYGFEFCISGILSQHYSQPEWIVEFSKLLYKKEHIYSPKRAHAQFGSRLLDTISTMGRMLDSPFVCHTKIKVSSEVSYLQTQQVNLPDVVFFTLSYGARRQERKL